MILGMLLVGAICGAINITIMDDKGYPKDEQVVWFICGLLFSLLGVLFAVVQPDYKKPEA